MTVNRHWEKTICPYDCPSSCGLLAEMEGDRILRITGDPEHPMTKGLICNKMRRYETSIYSEKRILTPLKRTGAKGSGSFVPITWEEAVQEITGRWKQLIEQEGAETILPVYYSGVMSVIQRKCGEAFFRKMGARRVVKTLCASAKEAAYQSVAGRTGCLDPRELKDSDFYVIWGSNVKATRIHIMRDLAEARRKGKRVVLIEVCGCEMAGYCDEVFLVKPGTDGALALAMMHVLAEEGLADEDFLRHRAFGYEEFRKGLACYTPEWAEQETGISAERIRNLARAFGKADAPAILLGSGLSRQGNGGMTTRLILILSAFTGAWGKPGGGYCGSNPGAGPYVDVKRVTRQDFRSEESYKKPPVNLNLLGEALLDQEIKSLYVYASNPAVSVSDQGKVLRGLGREDLFTVVHERFMTETAKYADIILPAAFSAEQSDCYLAFGYCTFGTARKLIQPQGMSKSNWETFRLLAEGMGYQEPYFYRTEEEVLEELLENPEPALQSISEKDWETLKKGGVISTPFADHGNFLTETGKFMIVNDQLEYPVPCYLKNYGGDQGLRLVMMPNLYTLNSVFFEREDLMEKRGAASIILHPEEAFKRGIRNGDRVIAYNDLGEAEFTAVVSSLIAKGAAAVSGVFENEISGKLTVNGLHHGRLADMGEATAMNDNTVEIRLK